MIDFDGIAQNLLTNLRKHSDEIADNCSLSSPRAVGDKVQEYLAKDGLVTVLEPYNISVISDFGRRAMEDMAFNDSEGNYYAVDVKTHNLDTKFNMPNLISVNRLAEFYNRSDNNYFCILIVSYHTENDILNFTACDFKPIESFDWSCLTLGALGAGQIQIANANKITFSAGTSRKAWMLKLCDKVACFYDNEATKISKRKKWFEEIRKVWDKK